MKTISEVVIYKSFTKDDIIELLELAHSGSGSIRLSDGTIASRLVNGKIELEIIEKDFEVEE